MISFDQRIRATSRNKQREKVWVSAQKVVESLQDVVIAVCTFRAEEFDAQGLRY